MFVQTQANKLMIIVDEHSACEVFAKGTYGGRRMMIPTIKSTRPIGRITLAPVTICPMPMNPSTRPIGCRRLAISQSFAECLSQFLADLIRRRRDNDSSNNSQRSATKHAIIGINMGLRVEGSVSHWGGTAPAGTRNNFTFGSFVFALSSYVIRPGFIFWLSTRYTIARFSSGHLPSDTI